ncbi:trypsin-like cysteine/serine peptidase domain-containing protein [Syncephalis pseudoplumigaleata]|uniref:Trypsin-like cysteine/serine peptidase domain-containing protein n=1 Tax=Syncephalis pseudoplumigaleata TaxID=1712513 RepID=A0A4P9YTM8_9FUNG|nr:trypsin-like cysteine/serine peptidase domain-containing protein [Syncephalis pseudoplumigaleata]|eukprot:RKP23135.1 trypsin-like cysteine/serine peptidase domain-containing protein [Syncephalis pseudoplumigaleata]
MLAPASLVAGVASCVLLAALLPASVSAATRQGIGLIVPDQDKGIYGGSSVVPEKFPFVAAIYERGNVSCGAAIIAPSWIVTAAHCLVVPDSSLGSVKAIYRAPISEVTVGVGSVSNTTKHPITVKRAIVSPAYNPSDNTIATDENCRKAYPDWSGQNSELVCTGNTPGKDTCYGDSGGPLVWPIPAGQPNAGRYALLAVTSFGINIDNPTSTECGEKGGIGFYTRAFHYADWIANTTHANATEMFVGASHSLHRRDAVAGMLFGPAALLALLAVLVSGYA